MTGLRVAKIGPAATIQDLGRAGYLGQGLSSGGAADPLALAEAAALLGGNEIGAALEMAGYGGEFVADDDMVIALTGAPMQVRLNGQAIAWNTTYTLSAGVHLSIGGASSGVYGYLSVCGGFQTDIILGSRSAHLIGGIGSRIEASTILPVRSDSTICAPHRTLTPPDRFSGGEVRVLPSAHTDMFDQATLNRFEQTEFHPTAKASRQAVELAFDGAPFATGVDQKTVLSQPMVPGDVQMTGEGMPYVMLPECQTTGGYPRIATVIPDDLPIIAQASAGTPLRFSMITRAEALDLHQPIAALIDSLKQKISTSGSAMDSSSLLSAQLISGAVSGQDDES